ncbi:MAG: isochorismate synthase [Myxococcales bacterium]|nr:isochorismate synthase [Myxococcales bacterium]MCB9530306.1 isochorismate synthase [Myxococcales bacterium]
MDAPQATPVAVESAVQRVRDGLATRAGRALQLSVPLERGDLPAAFAALGETPAWLWAAPDDGDQLLGVGAALRVTASGHDRFAALARDARAAEETAALTIGASWLVTLAFDDAPLSERWSGFEVAEAVLPAVLVERRRGEVTLHVTATADADADTVVREVGATLEALAAERGLGEERPRPEAGGPVGGAPVPSVAREGEAAYAARVEEVVSALRRGDAQKIVAARRVDLAAGAGVASRALLALDAAYPGCFRFAVRKRDGLTFVGASPERLVARQGRHVTTVALAGSSDLSETGVDALARSAKEADEHQYVVRHLSETLLSLGARHSAPGAPRLRRLQHIAHLETPVEADLDRDLHVLEVARALHPTPAVCGTPVKTARAWIVEREGADRGLYAGPIGWFNGRGDGELAVGIRSALVRGERLSLYAGAGIVAASSPEDEAKETSQKLRGLLAAFEVE